MDSGDWRAHLQPGFRRNSLRTIMAGLVRHFPGFCGEAQLMNFKRYALKIEARFYASSTSLAVYQTNLAQLMPTILARAKALNFARKPFDECPLSASPQDDKGNLGNATSDDDQIQHNKTYSENHMCLSGNLKDQKTEQPTGEPLTQELVPSQAVTPQDPPFQRLIQALKRTSIELPVTEQFNPSRFTGSDDTLLKEISKINGLLIDTVVEVSNQDVHEEGTTIVYCCFKPVSLSTNLKPLYELAPFQPIRLLIPESYPNRSPIWLEDFPFEAGSGFCNEASLNARSRFRFVLRDLSEPMSISEIASAWDICAREAISDFARQYGGGSFSNKNGDWRSCLASGSSTYLLGI